MSYESYNNEFESLLNDPLATAFLISFFLIGLVFIFIAYLVSALIYFKTSKTNGYEDVAYIAWIPFVNIYNLFLLIAQNEDDTTNRSTAKRNTLIYYGLFIVSFIPFIGFIGFIASIGMTGFMLYALYQLFYRWSGETGKAILYIILTFFTAGLFFAIYGLMHMSRPFKA